MQWDSEITENSIAQHEKLRSAVGIFPILLQLAAFVERHF